MKPVIFGTHDDRTLEQLNTCATAASAAGAVLCADGHLGYSMPIGGVVGYREHISPSGVGYDIGCGNKAVLTNLLVGDIEDDLPRLADEIYSRISFGMGRNNQQPVDHPVLDAIGEADFLPQRQLKDLAANQLGTVGAGNHYVDVFVDNLGQVWVGVHFGSRGFGHKTASGFLSMAQGGRFEDRGHEGEMMSPPVIFGIDDDIGEAYIAAMQLAGDYAYAGRDVVVSEVLDILGAQALDTVHNHHNYAWLEKHGDEHLWVVRKGATPAFPDQRGFVGASMGGTSVILAGLESPESAAALYSTVHGAGRAMSRTKAAGKQRRWWVNNLREDDTLYRTEEEALAPEGATKASRTKRIRGGGAIDFDAVQAELQLRGIELRGGAADEAPGAYKNLREVLAAHEGTVEVQASLHPLIVCMAGADVYDPFKD